MKELDKHRIITNVIKNFDFDKVHKAMKALKWGWYVPGTKNETEIPSKKQLIATATKLITDLVNSESTSISTGGFMASRSKNETGATFLLEFTVTTSEVSE